MSHSETESTTDMAYRRLEQAISKGRLRPGTPISEPKLASELDISRAALREALARLSAENYVERYPTGRYGRWRVKLMTRNDVVEIYTCRGTLEGLAAALASQAVASTTLSELRQDLEDAQEAYEKGDISAVIAATTRFHDGILNASGNSRLKALMALLRPRVIENRRLMLEHATRDRAFEDQNATLLDRISVGDAAGAETVAREIAQDDITAILQLYDLGVLVEDGALLN